MLHMKALVAVGNKGNPGYLAPIIAALLKQQQRGQFLMRFIRPQSLMVNSGELNVLVIELPAQEKSAREIEAYLPPLVHQNDRR